MFKLGFRNLIKRKGYTMINLAGLAVGISICMLIVLFIRDELSYDTFHPNGERIYRMVVDRKYPGRSTSYSLIPPSYSAAVKQECPEVEESTRLFNFLGGASIQYRYGDKVFEETKVFQVDSTFFRVFSNGFKAGNGSTALDQPNSVVMTESSAIKYFGSVDQAVGKLIQPEGQNNQALKVTAVCNDWPENAHFDFDLLLTTAGVEQFRQVNFVGFAAHTYFLLKPNSATEQLEAKIPSIITKYAAGDIARQFSIPFEEFQAAGNGYRYYLQPLTKIHLISHLDGELKPNGSAKAVFLFGIIACFILFLAIINFVNLATARSGERAREVGIRKTYGSQKKSLIFQFLVESGLMSMASLILAIGIIYLTLPYFNQLSGKSFQVQDFFTPVNLGVLVGMTVLTGFLGGIYPAFVLSSFQPITVLKGKFNNSAAGLNLRHGLVVFQFATSIILIICTLIVNRQMEYMTSNELGYHKDHTIVIQRTDLLDDQTLAFRSALKSIPGVVNVSGASAYPGDNNYFGVSWREVGKREPMTGRGVIVDEQYQSTFDLDLKEGRFFSKDFISDSLAVVLNEAAVKELGLQQPIGARLTTESDFLNGPDNQIYEYHVVGVLKDYNYQSLHLPITPLVFTSSARFRDVTFSGAVRLHPTHSEATLKAIEKKWNEFVKDHPFNYEFLDQTIARQYASETQTQRIFTFFSSLAIFIACIGLFGLAAYATQQRMKEIGVRKVLGATSGSIVTLLSKEFVKLILIAILIAFPIAWFSMRQWLQGFTYRVDLSWWIFALAALGSLLIALLTLSVQTLKAGWTNPTISLRSE